MQWTTDVRVAGSAGLGYLITCAGTRGRPHPAELRAFRRANASSRAWLRVPQQLGTPWVPPVTSALLVACGHRRAAAAAALVLPVGKGLEVLTKKLLQRPRPVAVTHTTLRDDAPEEGPALPSGHAAIAAATGYLLVREAASSAVGLVVVAGVALASYARVQQGAHWPTDVAAGALLGLAVGAGLRVATGA